MRKKKKKDEKEVGGEEDNKGRSRISRNQKRVSEFRGGDESPPPRLMGHRPYSFLLYFIGYRVPTLSLLSNWLISPLTSSRVFSSRLPLLLPSLSSVSSRSSGAGDQWEAQLDDNYTSRAMFNLKLG